MARSRTFSASVHEYPYGQIVWWAKTPAGRISVTETLGYNSRNICWHALGAIQIITSPLSLRNIVVCWTAASLWADQAFMWLNRCSGRVYSENRDTFNVRNLTDYS